MKKDELHVTPPNAISQWSRIEKALSSNRVAIFLDYDGTLTPIVSDPALAIISSEMTEVVKRVSNKYKTGIVTGRAKDTIYSFLRLPTLYYAASHGFDIRAPNDESIHTIGNEFLGPLVNFKNRMIERCRLVKGSMVEDNLYSISVHYRHVAEGDVAQLEGMVDKEVAGSPSPLRKGHGKKVFEIKPAINWNKGKAVEHLLSHMFPDHHESVLAIYLGDDITDEDAFQFLQTRGNGLGMGVWVKGDSAIRDTSAGFMLDSVDEVQTFLSKIVDIPKSNSSGKSANAKQQGSTQEDRGYNRSSAMDERKDGNRKNETETDSPVCVTRSLTRAMKRNGNASVAGSEPREKRRKDFVAKK